MSLLFNIVLLFTNINIKITLLCTYMKHISFIHFSKSSIINNYINELVPIHIFYNHIWSGYINMVCVIWCYNKCRVCVTVHGVNITTGCGQKTFMLERPKLAHYCYKFKHLWQELIVSILSAKWTNYCLMLLRGLNVTC